MNISFSSFFVILFISLYYCQSNSTYIDSFVIDNFTHAIPSISLTFGITGPEPIYSYSFDRSSDILGGERDIIFAILDSAPSTTETLNIYSDNLILTTTFMAYGYVTLQYDGLDGSSNLTDSNSVPFDLTEDNSLGFRLNIMSSSSTSMDISLYDTNGNNSTLEGYSILQSNGTEFTDYYIDYNLFNTSSLLLNSISALEFTIWYNDMIDFNLDTIATYKINDNINDYSNYYTNDYTNDYTSYLNSQSSILYSTIQSSYSYINISINTIYQTESSKLDYVTLLIGFLMGYITSLIMFSIMIIIIVILLYFTYHKKFKYHKLDSNEIQLSNILDEDEELSFAIEEEEEKEKEEEDNIENEDDIIENI